MTRDDMLMDKIFYICDDIAVRSHLAKLEGHELGNIYEILAAAQVALCILTRANDNKVYEDAV